MRRGKEIAQGSHASIAFLTKRIRESLFSNSQTKVALDDLLKNEAEIRWIMESFAKVCLQVNSEEELLDIYKKAKDAKLEVNLITDSGLTEFDGVPTNTCLAIGPDYSDKIDEVTKHLKLY